MKRIILTCLLLIFCLNCNAGINFRKVLMVGTSLTGSYLEATTEARHRSVIHYHEFSYTSKVMYFSTGFLLGIDHVKKDRSLLYSIKDALALVLMNWPIWERRYAWVAGDNGTYNGWPFDESWIDPQTVWVWDLGRFLFGFILYIM